MGKTVKKLSLFNTETGEVVEDMLVFIGQKPTMVDKGYVKVFISFLEDVVANDQIAGKAIRLLMLMLQELDWNTLEVYLYPDDAAAKLNVTRRSVYNWLDILLDAGIIDRTNRRYIYKLSAYTAIKGKMCDVIDQQKTAKLKSKSKVKGGKKS